MDIGKLCAEGKCFRCQKKGHLSKDCPEKKDFRDIRSVQVTNEPVTESKVKEDLHTGARLSSAGRSYSTFLATSCLPTHSDIPAPILHAINVSHMTSTPVSESQNRYTVLSVEEYDHSNTSTDEAEEEAESLPTLRNFGANRRVSSLCRETQPTKAPDEKSPTKVTLITMASVEPRLDEAWAKLKYTPCEAPSQDGQAAPQEENTARNLTTPANRSRAVARPRMGINRQPPKVLEGTGETGNSAPHAVQAQPDTILRIGPPREGEDDPGIPPLKEQGRSPEEIPRTATGQEAASAQAVNRGHQVTLIEVPDEDDNMAYQIWLTKE
ncbi:uncharacterized protein ARMOST_10199 [Armillaria ostoyae]|uniref:CCHC-type domain-containing protein n=1 Tax=Armillaria ostoyae TaxID=47428 RepID=A0A284RDM4_ARMOS|nr:uncharacterized protein ARMOST_10199 [Armillaria ostoyae]